jgi:hypothetical protein
VAQDRTRGLERRRAELLERRRELREAGAPASEIIPVIEELDRIDAELRPVATERPAEDDALRWKDALIVGAAAIVVGAVATGAAALGFRSSSAGATTADSVVRVRLHSGLNATACSTTSARARLTWSWKLESSGHDGEVAVIRATGAGLAPRYRVRVSDDQVRLIRTTPCEPAGTTVWRARLVRVGSLPATLSH